jgi:hypothetical protein
MCLSKGAMYITCFTYLALPRVYPYSAVSQMLVFDAVLFSNPFNIEDDPLIHAKVRYETEHPTPPARGLYSLNIKVSKVFDTHPS